MSIEVLQDNLCVNRLIEGKKKEITLESSIIVPDIKPDIVKPIDLSGNVCIYKKEVLDGKVRIDGNVNAYVIYLADNEEESIRSLNTNIDFTQVLDFEGCNSDMSVDENVSVKSIECKILNGRKINVKATLQFEMKVYFN